MIKPVYIMFEPGLSLIQKAITIEALNEVLTIAKAKDKIPVKNFGEWRNTTWRDGNILLPYQSVDWYCQQALNQDRNQLDADQLSVALAVEPWQKHQLHFDIVVTKRDLFCENTNWVLGCAMHDLASISSVFRVEQWIKNDQYLQNECFRTIVMHEICHMFGLIRNKSRRDITQSLGLHCTNNACIMRQGLTIDAWKNHTRDRLRASSPLCTNCRQDLQNYFMN